LYVGSDKAPRQKKQSFLSTDLKPTKERVPQYRFHHVEIARNILTPSTNLRFLPYTRDVQDAREESQYYSWIDSLKGMDQTDGMDTLALEESHARNNKKAQFMARKEFAATLHPYLERWITRLGLEHCDRAALIHYMASETADGDSAITPQQKSTLLGSDIGSSRRPDSHAAAKAFTEAFDRVFGRRATLREVLMLDEAVEDLLQRSRRPKELVSSQKPREDDILLELEDAVATNNLFNCLICFCYGCDHGSINVDENTQSRLSLTNVMLKMAPMVKKKWIEQTKKNQRTSVGIAVATQCKNQCFQASHPTKSAPRDWTPREVQTLKAMFVALAKSSLRPECTAAVMLSRKCWDVREKVVALHLSLPYTPPPPEQPWARNLGWYDRIRKTFVGDSWKEQTVTHDFGNRELTESCDHEGACTVENGCPCVYGKILCDRFCQCSADFCPYKFTGCSCHSSGRNCLERVRKGENPCICVTLNRECDPVLCKGCGAAERANPVNMHDHALHATGCQNVSMQRGLPKAVLMGASQLEGCGYGLFTAEDIAQDEFVIEYTGELIRSDEGVRREARRGNVFDESKNTSYLFTLLETEGVWVDAAVYGNLSRYINHAGDHDKKGANLTPKIVYVLGEYRIRFTATRDIKRGEELFFNYGDNFPNLTKKLLEDKDAEASGRRKPGPKPGPKPGRKPGRPPSKMVKNKQKDDDFAPRPKPGRPRGRGSATKKAPTAASGAGPEEMDWEATAAVGNEKTGEEEDGEDDEGGAKPRLLQPPSDDDDYDEYRPGNRTDSQEDREAYRLARDRARRRFKADNSHRDYLLIGDYSNIEPLDIDFLSSDPPEAGGPGKTATTTAAKSSTASPNKTGKPVSRRGGARPGAGRKPKNPKPTTPAATTARTESAAYARRKEEEEEGDNDDEIADSYAAAEEAEEEEDDSDDDSVPPVEQGRGYSLRIGKRKSAERDGDDEDKEMSGFADDGMGGVSELGASQGSSRDDDEEDDEDEDDVIDRSRRKRQKPARYRADE
jgi:hypothetical protein